MTAKESMNPLYARVYGGQTENIFPAFTIIYKESTYFHREPPYFRREPPHEAEEAPYIHTFTLYILGNRPFHPTPPTPLTPQNIDFSEEFSYLKHV